MKIINFIYLFSVFGAVSENPSKCFKLRFNDLPRISRRINIEEIRLTPKIYRDTLRPHGSLYNGIKTFLLTKSQHHLVWSQPERDNCEIDRKTLERNLGQMNKLGNYPAGFSIFFGKMRAQPSSARRELFSSGIPRFIPDVPPMSSALPRSGQQELLPRLPSMSADFSESDEAGPSEFDTIQTIISPARTPNFITRRKSTDESSSEPGTLVGSSQQKGRSSRQNQLETPERRIPTPKQSSSTRRKSARLRSKQREQNQLSKLSSDGHVIVNCRLRSESKNTETEHEMLNPGEDCQTEVDKTCSSSISLFQLTRLDISACSAEQQTYHNRETYPLSTLAKVLELYAAGKRPTEISFFFNSLLNYVPCLRQHQLSAEPENKLRAPKSTYIKDLQGALPIIMQNHTRSFIQSSKFLTLSLDGTIDARASKSYGVALINEIGTIHLLAFRLLTSENGEIIKTVVLEELQKTGLYETLKIKIHYIMSDTSASQLRGNRLLQEELGGNVKVLRCVMHATSNMDSYAYRRYLTKTACSKREELDDLRLPDDLPAEHEFQQGTEDQQQRREKLCPSMSVKLHTALMILLGGRLTQRASRNDIRKEAEAILLRDYQSSRKFFFTNQGCRFGIRARNYQGLLITRIVVEEAVKNNAHKNKYAKLFLEEFFNAKDFKIEAEMSQAFLLFFSIIEPFYERTKEVTSTLQKIIDEFERTKEDLESLKEAGQNAFKKAVALIKNSEFLVDDTLQGIPNLERKYKIASPEDKRYMNDEIRENAKEISKKLDKEFNEWINLDIDRQSVIISDNALIESAFSILKARQRVDTASHGINIYRSASMKISGTHLWLDDQTDAIKNELYTRGWCAKSEQLKADRALEEQSKLQYLN